VEGNEKSQSHPLFKYVPVGSRGKPVGLHREHAEPQWVQVWRYDSSQDQAPASAGHADAVVGAIIELTGAVFELDGKKSEDSTASRPDDEWVFRGQEDSTWAVVPKSRRLHPDAKAPLSPFIGIEADLEDYLLMNALGEERPLLERICKASRGQDRVTWAGFHAHGNGGALLSILHRLRCAAEFQAVRDFADVADDAGLVIHDRVADLPSGKELLVQDETQWVPSRTTALAQHHGIATKLLDWTRRVKVAVYFATQPIQISLSYEPVALAAVQPEKCAVWALNMKGLSTLSYTDDRDMPYVRRLDCDHATNSFLHAQDGLFTWFDESQQRRYYCKHRCYPDLIEVLVAEGLNVPGVLKKFEIDRKIAHQLRQRLRADRISRATVMPAYDHVSVSVQHRWLDLLRRVKS